jgi:hypothetical protein
VGLTYEWINAVTQERVVLPGTGWDPKRAWPFPVLVSVFPPDRFLPRVPAMTPVVTQMVTSALGLPASKILSLSQSLFCT